MPHRSTSPWRLAAVAALAALPLAARANDAMFPSAPAAQSAITVDGKGFVINGRRTFVVSGSLHYARLPRAQWREMLLKFKRAGYNTVQTYVFWNWQEPREGQWDFTGSHDLDGFLKLVKLMGMYATVRVGPYCCAEWDSGGYPVWLRFKPGLEVREDNPQYMAEAGKWYTKILGIVAANQINRGGPVILMQVENEDPDGWGTDIPNSYFRKLYQIVLANGIQIPFFFSGMHHGSDPAGDRPWDNSDRTTPWYSTEFWAGWIGRFGPPTPDQLTSIVRGDWKIQAYGGNGYNHYMLYGGTNFDTYNNDEDASSYDYGSAISQSGGLRDLYYQDKRAALFATSFPQILENSSNATAQHADAATNASVRVTARSGSAGTILYLDNNGSTPAQTQVKDSAGTLFPTSGPLTLAPGEIMPVVVNTPLAPGITMTMGATQLLGMTQQGQTLTLVAYGDPGSNGQIVFTTLDGAKPVTLTFPSDVPQSQEFRSGRTTVRVLSMAPDLADRTWFVDTDAGRKIVVGPDYLGDTSVSSGRLTLDLETAANSPLPAGPDTVRVYGPGTAPALATIPTKAVPAMFSQPTNWQEQSGDAEATPTYRDSTWLASDTPQQMGADGDDSAYAWYRTTVSAPTGGAYTLHFTDAGDWLRVFVDGGPSAILKPKTRGTNPVAWNVPVTMTAGRHTLAVLTAHYGRNKLYPYRGPINQIYAKGLNGPVLLQAGDHAQEGRPITGWRARLDPGAQQDAAQETATPLDTSGPDWQDAAIGQDVFHQRPGLAWFRTDLGTDAAPHHTLHFESVDDNGTVYLNGVQLTTHEGWNDPFDVPLDAAWNPKGPNVVAVMVQNTDGAGGIGGPVTLLNPSQAGTPITGWRMRGNVTGTSAAAWQPLAATAPGVPTFYRSTFTYHVPAVGDHPVLRATFAGLSRGFLFLNGHNLGRYPERCPTDSIYLPEAFLTPGVNTLTVFDEDGALPNQIKLVRDSEATHVDSRVTLALP